MASYLSRFVLYIDVVSLLENCYSRLHAARSNDKQSGVNSSGSAVIFFR